MSKHIEVSEYGLTLVCTKCNKSKLIDQYYIIDKKTGRRRRKCKSCDIAQATQSRSEIQRGDKRWLARRDNFLRKKYKISFEDYETMLDKQNGKCALCDNLPKLNKYFHVDHDHNTGIVRGLLCPQCNMLLGQIEGRLKSDFDRLSSYIGKGRNV